MHTGAIEPLAVLLVTPGTWASVEAAALRTVSELVMGRALKADSPDSPLLVAALCGLLNPSERSAAIIDQAVRILALLTEQGAHHLVAR